MARAEQIRARNAYLIARHRCVQCRRQDEVTLAGSRLCGRCKEQQRERSRIRYAENRQRDIARVKALREARKAAGLCVVCGGERDRDDRLTCSACLEKERKRRGESRGRKRRRREDGA